MPDLRARLVEVGVDLVTREGTGALSLREIARRAGVSHGAPRRYFPTHLSLLAAIAAEGYRGLAARIAALEPHAPPRARVTALARLYLDFARGNRGMFELMFRHEVLRGNDVGLRETSRPLFRVLVDLVAAARPDVARPAVVAGALWANLHGIAQLGQWGSLQMVLDSDDLEPLLDAAVTAHLGGSS
ncbi:TetR/AcrR family transcriptional regulator [Luedemannella flava]|uniref:TetR/AcrR family transcriptional regulator n=1 Tax=Luedemannella flava TaxID=349316 RepID=A0ABP4YNY8_9ACTN